MARRFYSIEKKMAIVGFALSQGKGGISKAVAKYGVSFAALQSWMGGKNPAKMRKRTIPRKIDGRNLRRIQSTLRMIKVVEKQISALRKSLKGL